MEHGAAAIRAEFAKWDRQIARLQERCLAASGGEVERLRAALAQLAGARERAWWRWEVARAGGMWVKAEDVQRFQEAMRMAAEAAARAGLASRPRPGFRAGRPVGFPVRPGGGGRAPRGRRGAPASGGTPRPE